MKGKRLAMETSPEFGHLHLVAEVVKNRRRHQILLEDYQDLIKENEAKKEELQKARQKKLKLLAEVKFLRRKFNKLSKNPTGKKVYRVKKASQAVMFQFFHTGQSLILGTQNEVPMVHMMPPVRESAFPSTSTMIDLNKVSVPPNTTNIVEFQASLDHLNVGKLKKSTTDGDNVANDQKFPICCNVGSEANGVQKRKITWRDQLALKA